ncbi:MAG: carbon-nitrogen hydrolase family protein [Alphaproteobacteria bacterium]|nr:carbon-nitrogen hydrolase family protein [Alphaproteobacteria bacterium]MBF0249514.1 carbon-nitrogen hydrolase family protein [Alphaproteobacteria bacterium]
MTAFKAACVQLNASNDMAANIKAAAEGARRAAGMGAKLILFPENVAMMTFGPDNIRAMARPQTDHPAIPAFAALAKELGVWLHGGTLAIWSGERVANRAFVFSPDGAIRATYDKIHMFDVDLPGGESYRESETFTPGDALVVANTPWGGLGLSTCYDVRFPYLYRALAQSGAGMLAVPSAFTVPTGRAHWHVLLRARAIENGCYVFAPAQTGVHFAGRRTYGHSLIVDPWGDVLADGGDGPGVIVADIDPARVQEVRAQIPSLRHTREIP